MKEKNVSFNKRKKKLLLVRRSKSMIQKQKIKTLPIETGIDTEDVVQLTGRSFKQGYLKV